MRSLSPFLALEQASNIAPEMDWIFYALLILCGAITLLVVFLITVFCIRYRRGSNASRAGNAPSLPFEIGWTLPTLCIFIAIFFWAAKLFFKMSKPPVDAVEINVVGKQWMWKIQHADGRREIDELHLPV